MSDNFFDDFLVPPDLEDKQQEQEPNKIDPISPEEFKAWNERLDKKNAEKITDLTTEEIIDILNKSHTIISTDQVEDKYSKLKESTNNEIVLFEKIKTIDNFDPRAPKPACVKQILSEYFIFRYDVIRGRTQFAHIDDPTEFHNLEDRHINSIRSNLLDHYMKSISKEDLYMVIESDFATDYNFIKEYFSALPSWDMNQTDYIKQLADLIIPEEKQYGENMNSKEIFYDYLSRWLIGNVACMLGRSENHQCLILLGEQGIGKTRWLRNLCISNDLSFVGAYNPEDKDSKLLLTEKTLIVLDEFESTTRHELASLKSDITKNQITIRRPYGRIHEDLPRRASFCASVNGENFLSDLTGSRRWLCVKISSVDYKSVTTDLMKNVYSQALYLFNIGKKYWFDGDDIKKIEVCNTIFYEVCQEEEALFKIIYPQNQQPLNFVAEVLTNTELLGKMNTCFPGMKFSSKKLGQVLKKHNFKRIGREDALYGYEVILKS